MISHFNQFYRQKLAFCLLFDIYYNYYVFNTIFFEIYDFKFVKLAKTSKGTVKSPKNALKIQSSSKRLFTLSTKNPVKLRYDRNADLKYEEEFYEDSDYEEFVKEFENKHLSL